MAAPKARVAFPVRCAVAVVCGEHLVSQVYPAAVPIEVFLDDVVELLNDELKRRGLGGLDAVDGADAGVGYELAKANGVRLDVTRTLDELGVEDGATLVLVPSAPGESFEPQYESLSTGLARIGKKLFAPVTADTAAHTALAVLAMTVTATVGLVLRCRTATDAPLLAVAAGATGLAAAGGAAAVWRWWSHRTDLLTGFAWVAAPPLAVALGAAAPGRLAAPHLFLTALAAILLVVGIAAATKRLIAVAAAAVTGCGLGCAVAAVRMWRPVPAQWLGMATLIVLLFLLTAAPTLALWCAGIRPPHFGSITGRDLFRRGPGLPADAVSPVEADTPEADADATGRTALITAAAIRANSVLTGICVGAGAALPAAVWPTLMPGQRHSTAAAVLAGLFVTIYLSRARAYADKRQAVALVCGAAAAVCAGVVKYVYPYFYVAHQPAGSAAAVLAAALVLGGFGGAALVAALLVPATRFTPLVRMVAEWVELVAIVAALPLAAWIGGLYSWVRMR